MFEELDSFCGTSTMICKAREKLPEPSRVEYPVICFIDRSPKPFNWLDNSPNLLEPTEKHSMVKVRMVYKGTVFWAWKSEDDGKIYI